MFTIHGYPKLMGGQAAWTEVGGVMKLVGLDFAPTAWGLLAAVAEAVGGQLLAVGLFFRITCAALLITMIMAAIMHISKGDGFAGYSHAVEAAFVFLGLLSMAPAGIASINYCFQVRVGYINRGIHHGRTAKSPIS